jgi:hypothetical protein
MNMTMLAIRVHNSTRSCTLMRQFSNGLWTLPVMIIKDDADPYYYLDEILKQVEGEFELLSAVSIVDHENQDTLTRSIVYDVKYRGKVHSGCPDAFKNKYIKSKWMTADMIMEQTSLSSPTKALVAAMKIDSSMK